MQPQLTPHQVRNAEFHKMLGGLDRTAVRRLLGQLADAMEQGRSPAALLPAAIPFQRGVLGISRGYAAHEVVNLVEAVRATDPAAPASPAPPAPPTGAARPADPRLLGSPVIIIDRGTPHPVTEQVSWAVLDGTGQQLGVTRLLHSDPAASMSAPDGIWVGKPVAPAARWDWLVEDLHGNGALAINVGHGNPGFLVSAPDGREVGWLVPVAPTGVKRVRARMWAGKEWADQASESCELRVGQQVWARVVRRGRRSFAVVGRDGAELGTIEESKRLLPPQQRTTVHLSQHLAPPARTLAMAVGVLSLEVFPKPPEAAS